MHGQEGFCLLVVRAHAGEPHLLFQIFARTFTDRSDFVQTSLSRKHLAAQFGVVVWPGLISVGWRRLSWAGQCQRKLGENALDGLDTH
jgi:hypothetical protein